MENICLLSTEVRHILALLAKLSKTQSERESEKIRRQVLATDHRIDQIVYGLYQLTEEEISIVENTPNVEAAT
jgi:hypothetical protein